MTHYFDIETAEKYGVNAAVILYNIKYWVAKNESENRHFHNGKYWTYMSKSGLAKLFPYMTVRQIDYALKKLEDAGLIICGNFNDKQFDRTKWYALADDADKTDENGDADNDDAAETAEKPHTYAFDKIVQSNEQNCSIEQTKLSNRCDKIVGCNNNIIYNNIYNTNNKPNSKSNINGGETPLADKHLEHVIMTVGDFELRQELREFVRMRKSIRKPPTPHALELILKQLTGMSRNREIQLAILRQSIQNCWQGLYELKNNVMTDVGTEMKPTTDTAELEDRFMRGYS